MAGRSGGVEFLPVRVADEWRAEATNGLHYLSGPSPESWYFHRLLEMAADILALCGGESKMKVRRAILPDSSVRTPLLGAAIAGDPVDIAYARVGGRETLSSTVHRLARERFGVRVPALRLLGLVDCRPSLLHSMHTYYVVFGAKGDAGYADAKAVLQKEPEHSMPRIAPPELAELQGLVRDAHRLATAALAACGDSHARQRFRKVLMSADTLRRVLLESAPATTSLGLLLADTPRVGAEAAIFDKSDRILLIERTDTGQWAMPGGACEVGEDWETGARRELWEETNLRPGSLALAGLVDNRYIGAETSTISVVAVYVGRSDGRTAVHEGPEVAGSAWLSEKEAFRRDLYMGHRYKIEVCFRRLRGVAKRGCDVIPELTPDPGGA